MEITVTQEDALTVIALVGRLDTNTSPELEKCAEGLYAKGVKNIAVDMAECEFVSSAGLRVIVAMQKKAAMGGTLVFRNVVPDVMNVFEMTGFDNILTLE